jgi:NADP-dependent 3-hydroxy acid dehydrogenase YdfG
MSAKRILITGASSGIGRAAALHLAQKGHHVLMAARRTDRLREIAESSPAIVGEFLVGELDVSSTESINKFFETHAKWLEGLDALVNNAGLALGREALQDYSLGDIETMIDTNVKGLLAMTHRALPLMIKRGKGDVVNLGSIAGRTPYAGGAVYCATKAAVHMITDALRIDVGGTGVRVSTVAPGRVETEFSLVRYKGNEEEAKKVYSALKPLSALDVAETIAWILERPAHVNIQEVVIMPTDQPTATTLAPKKR